MPGALSTYLFRNTTLGVHTLDQIARAGFEQIEIYCARSHFDYTDPSHVREVAEWFADSSVRLHSLHAPLHRDLEGASPHAVVSIAFVERQRRQDSMDEIKRALEVAERIPFRYLIAHLGVLSEEFDLRKFDAALTSLEHLRVFASPRGVEILLENIPNELSTPARLLEFFQHTHMRDLKVCFDAGHAQLDGGVLPAIELLRGSIASTHLHDNTGAKDDHMVPGDGMIPWEKTIPALRQHAPGAPLLLEVRGSDGSDYLERAAKVAEQWERMSEEASS